MATRLTRQSFLNALACPRLGWFSRRETPPEPLTREQGTLADRYRSDEQKHVHDTAIALFPGAARVTRQAYEAACWQTQDLLDRPSTGAILEAAFGTGNCRARADALVRSGDAWHLYEIKAGTNVSARLVDEVAFIWMVIEATGASLSRASLLLVSQDYRTGMADEALFNAVDITSSAAARADEFAKATASIDSETRGSEPPPGRLIPHCRQCLMFRTCIGADIDHPVFELPHLTPLQLEEMLRRGYRSVTDITEEGLLKGRQAAAWRAIVTRRPVYVGSLSAALDMVQWPASYLDFETIGTAIPLFPDLAPFERLPFLYSARMCSRPGVPESHRSFLSPHDRDGTRELAERLVQDLGTEGSVIIYSQYQARVIRWLAQRYPDLAEPLRRVRERLVDLEGVVRHTLCHPGFRGRTSLSTVLPALVPQMSYIDLEIEDDDSASAAYAYLARGGYYSAARAPLVRRDLYAYCARDTLALVKLHEALHALAREG